MKYILVIGDGIADRPLAELQGKTPLEVADMPTINALAQRAEVGTARTVPEGIAPGSDTAILSIFGYDPRQYYTGRSPLEAAGMGCDIQPGNMFMRANLVSLRGEGPLTQRTMVSHSGGGIEGADALGLMDALLSDSQFKALAEQAGLTFAVSPTFRQIAVFERQPETDFGTVPPHDILEQPVEASLGNLTGAQLALMQAAMEVLERHPINQNRKAAGKLPANGMWFWGEGQGTTLPAFQDSTGHTGLVVSAVPLVKGIARLAGLEAPEVPGATGELETDYQAKVDTALAALKTHDFAALHVEAPDECSHMGDRAGKLLAIHYLSERLMKPLIAGLEELGEYRVLLMSDHATPLSTRTHGAEPVPYLIFDSRRDEAGTSIFCEAQANQGRHEPEGAQLIRRFLEK